MVESRIGRSRNFKTPESSLKNSHTTGVESKSHWSFEGAARLARLEVSEALLPELAGRPGVRIVSEPAPPAFDARGNLC